MYYTPAPVPQQSPAAIRCCGRRYRRLLFVLVEDLCDITSAPDRCLKRRLGGVYIRANCGSQGSCHSQYYTVLISNVVVYNNAYFSFFINWVHCCAQVRNAKCHKRSDCRVIRHDVYCWRFVIHGKLCVSREDAIVGTHVQTVGAKWGWATDIRITVLLLSAPLRSNGSRLCFTSVYSFFLSFFLFTVRSQKLIDRFSPNFQE